MARSHRPGSAASALFVFGACATLPGCSLPDEGFRTQGHAAPSGPCWSVDLGDGLDEDSADELQLLFACLDRDGTLRPLAPLVDRLDTPDRESAPIGATLAGLINSLPSLDIEVWGLAGTALALLEAEEPVVGPLLEVGVELLYGRPWGTVRTEVTLSDPEALARGVVRPVLPLLGQTATVVLDESEDLPGRIADGLTDPLLADAVCTLTGIAESQDPSVRSIADRIMDDLGVALLLARDASNDRWSDASGDSARDLTTALLESRDASGRTFLESTRAPLTTILEDTGLRSRVESAVADAASGERLAALPLQLRYLSETAVDGGELRGSDDSALLAFLRLLHHANEPMACSLDLWVTNLEVDLGNLSVSVLRTLSRIDPDTTRSGVSLLGAVLGWDLSQVTLELVADSGVCPVLDRQLVADLQSVDRLNDPETGDLLAVTLELVAAFDQPAAEDDRVPELVDVLAQIHATGLVFPLEELLRDIGDSALLADAMAAVPLVLDPTPLDVAACPSGSRPLAFDDIWGITRGALVGDGQASLVDDLQPVLQLWLGDDATWEASHHLAMLLTADGARLREAPSLLAALVMADPELSAIDDMARLLAEPRLTTPLLRITESPVVADELARTELDREGPLPFLARLVTGGTLDVVLRTIDLIIGWLTGLTEHLEESRP